MFTHAVLSRVYKFVVTASEDIWAASSHNAIPTMQTLRRVSWPCGRPADIHACVAGRANTFK